MDNRYFQYNSPALRDYRFITNYMPRRTFEQSIRKLNSISSAQEYRTFLQVNGDTIMNRERAFHENTNTGSVMGKCLPLSKPANFEIAPFCRGPGYCPK